MKKKIIALAGSNSKNSINKELAYYTAGNMTNADVIYLDLNDFVMPMYGIDEENENGMPEAAQKLSKLITNADGVVLSLAEHNGSYSAVFKNTFDWISRIDAKVFETSPVFLLSTSPGARAGQSVMEAALDRFPRHGATVVAHFSLPSFYDNFKESQLINEEFREELMGKLAVFEKVI